MKFKAQVTPEQLADMLNQGLDQPAIAQRLGVTQSSVSRMIARMLDKVYVPKPVKE